MSVSENTLVPPLKWHGGKHYLAGRIVALMPPRQSKEHPEGWCHYVEPFFGGGAVLLAQDPEGISEVVNDLDGELTNFWRVLQREAPFGLMRDWLEAVPFSEVEFAEAGPNYVPEKGADVLRAVKFFVRCRQSLAGRMVCFAPLSRNRTRRGMNEQASAWLAAVEGLPGVHARLKRVVILNRDACDVIRAQDGPRTLFYLDPPYFPDSRASPTVYRHEMSQEGHHNLLCLVRQCRGRVILSGYRNAMYDDLLKGWTRHDFELPNNSAGGDSKRRMTECLWCNF